MSVTSPNDRSQAAGGAADACAEVHARFQIRGASAQEAASIAAELIDRLQELSGRTDCECDLDLTVGRQA